MTIPILLLKEVLANDGARELLLLLENHKKPLRYSEARKMLGLHPQQFQRSLERLEDHGLVGIRAPSDLNKPHAGRTYYIFLENTALGSFAAELWQRFNTNYAQLAKEHNLPENVIAASE